MTRPAAPDPARARLRGLGPTTWAGSGVGVDVPAAPAAPEPGSERIGWPTAPPGTPAARLRLGGPSTSPPWPGWPDPSVDDHDHDHDTHGRAAPDPPTWGGRALGSAWDAAEQGRERWTRRWLPASWQGARWDPGRTGALALAVVTALAAVAAAVGVWHDRPVAEPVPALPAIAAAPSSVGLPGIGGAALPALDGRPVVPRTGPIVVSVAGRVARPGLVRLPEGSRVGDALSAAGGAARGVDLTGLNLAQRLADGEQVVVGVRMPGPGGGVATGGVMGAGAPGASGGGAGGGSGGGASGGAGGGGGGRGPAASAGGALDLNAASLEQLDQLPGVGPVTAQKILDWRTEHGRFAAIEQLQEVGGIGEARFAQLRARVRV